MADLPTNYYDQFTQNQEDSGRNIYDFWENQFAKFNPTAPQVTPTNTMTGFNNAGAQTINDMKGLMGGSGAPGSFNVNGANSRIMNQENSRGLKQNLGNDMSVMNENYATNMKYGLGGLCRENQLAGIQGKVNELPVDRMGQNFATTDTINSAQNNYNDSKPDWFESLLGGAGSVGGTVLGNKLTKPSNSWDDFFKDKVDMRQPDYSTLE